MGRCPIKFVTPVLVPLAVVVAPPVVSVVLAPVVLCVPPRHRPPRWRPCYTWEMEPLDTLGRLRVVTWKRQLVAVPTHPDLVPRIVPVGRLCIPPPTNWELRCRVDLFISLEWRVFLAFIPLRLILNSPLRIKLRMFWFVAWFICPIGLGPPGGPRPVSPLPVPLSPLLCRLTWSPDVVVRLRPSPRWNPDPRISRLEAFLVLGFVVPPALRPTS